MPQSLPLNALRAFEAAARHGSFVGAGQELAVSAPAVSQQVKLLEEALGKQLFLRQGNKIALTDAGRTLYPGVGNAFAELRAATHAISSGPKRDRVRVSVLPSLADLWLLPALRHYPARSRLDIRVEDDPPDLMRDRIDLRLTYGGQSYPGHIVDVLFTDHLVAVAAPDLHLPADPTLISDGDLIHTDWGRDYGVHPEWAAHFDSLGLRRMPDIGAGLRVDSTSLAVAAARAGLGAALVPERLVSAEISLGTLRPLGPSTRALPRDYVMVTPPSRARHRGTQHLRTHLLGVVTLSAVGNPTSPENMT